MTRRDKPWALRLKQDAQHSTVRHRSRPTVAILTAFTVVLALAGLIVDLQTGSRWLPVACYAAAVLSGGILLAFLYDKRLRVTRPPR
jgi:hypothetical protein